MRRLRAWARRRRERGAVAVEFALVLPLFLLLVLGGIDWGYYFFATQVAANAAREAARAASMLSTHCADSTGPPAQLGGRSIAVNYLQRGQLITGASDARLKGGTTFDCASGNSCCEQTTDTVSGVTVQVVRVTVVYQARPTTGSMSLTGFLPAGLLPSRVSATATMRFAP